MAKIGVLGAGTWGTALARMLAENGHEVTMWSALPQELEAMAATHTHPNLKGMTLPQSLAYTPSLAQLCSGRELLLFAVPSVYLRSTIHNALPHLQPGQVLVDVAKGIEPDTLFTMSQVMASELRTQPALQKMPVVALSGPTHAEEVALDLPTTIVASCEDPQAAEYVQDVFMNPNFRVYTNPDTMGVELGGAVKNIIALACGIAHGLGYGDNASAALITRGAAEIGRLILAKGGKTETIAGLAVIGDLIVTCTSTHSRNFRAGVLMGQGVGRAEAVAQVGMVVEGLNALPGVCAMAKQCQVEMPIVTMVEQIVAGRITAQQAVDRLMGRERTTEFRS